MFAAERTILDCLTYWHSKPVAPGESAMSAAVEAAGKGWGKKRYEIVTSAKTIGMPCSRPPPPLTRKRRATKAVGKSGSIPAKKKQQATFSDKKAFISR